MYAAGANRLRASVKDIERDPTDIEFLYYQASVTDESAQSAFEAAQRFLRGYYPWPLSVEEIRNRGAFGPPETTIDHIQAYVDAGVETFVTRFPTRDQHGRLRRYAEFIEAMG